MEHVNPPLILNSVYMVSILYKHLLNSHRLVVVNPPFDFSRSASVACHSCECDRCIDLHKLSVWTCHAVLYYKLTH